MTVEELLKQKDRFYSSKGSDFIINCLNPEHEDRNPSCRVDKITGVFHCFSCGYKGNLFSIYDIQRDVLAAKAHKLMIQIQKIKVATRGIEIPEGSIPFLREYRDIQASTFEKFEAFTNDIEYPERVVFPIKDVTGKIYALQSRHLYRSGRDKYINHPKGVSLSPFPCIVEPIQGSIILVEGLFDMLNLHDKGLTNTICIFGVSTLTKLETVFKCFKIFKFQGVQKIYIMLDGDAPGRSAAKTLKETLDSTTIFDTDMYHLEDNQDPGSLSKEQVQTIKKALYG